MGKAIMRRLRGFSLVELLIVVAIIGVLSTVGVPTFKKMLQKSRQSEAKVNLGAAYTIEAAFNSEYGSYGNNLGVMGFDIDGLPSQLIYAVGIAASNTCNAPAVLPVVSSIYGIAINSAIPTYYTAIASSNFVFGRISFKKCATATSSTVGTFQVTADGVIAPGVPKDSPLDDSTEPVDRWTIDNNRNLANSKSGLL